MDRQHDEAHLDLLTRIELESVAHRQGYRVDRLETAGWLRQRSASAPGTLWLSGVGLRGPFFAATDHRGVAREIPGSSPGDHPGIAAWTVETVNDLHSLVDQIYRLSVSLPTHPLAIFQNRLAKEEIVATETEAMRKLRLGQDVFRAALIEYWSGRCPLTGITDPELLRASHIRPWADSSDAERLDVHNGLLLSALWDAAFDRGLVTFDDRGLAMFSPTLSNPAQAMLSGAGPTPCIMGLKPEHLLRLADHRKRHGFPN